MFFIGYSRERQFITILSLIFVYFVYISRFTIRPDLFSLTFFTIYIFIMSLHIDKRWSLPALVIVQILWTNFHGFFFFGPLFIMIGLFSEWLKRRIPLPWDWNNVGRLTDEEYGRMKIALGLVTVACLANPQFIEGALYPIKVFFSLSGGDSIFFDYIQELKPPVEWQNFFGGGDYAYYKLMIIVSALTFYPQPPADRCQRVDPVDHLFAVLPESDPEYFVLRVHRVSVHHHQLLLSGHLRSGPAAVQEQEVRVHHRDLLQGSCCCCLSRKISM